MRPNKTGTTRSMAEDSNNIIMANASIGISGTASDAMRRKETVIFFRNKRISKTNVGQTRAKKKINLFRPLSALLDFNQAARVVDGQGRSWRAWLRLFMLFPQTGKTLVSGLVVRLTRCSNGRLCHEQAIWNAANEKARKNQIVAERIQTDKIRRKQEIRLHHTEHHRNEQHDERQRRKHSHLCWPNTQNPHQNRDDNPTDQTKDDEIELGWAEAITNNLSVKKRLKSNRSIAWKNKNKKRETFFFPLFFFLIPYQAKRKPPTRTKCRADRSPARQETMAAPEQVFLDPAYRSTWWTQAVPVPLCERSASFPEKLCHKTIRMIKKKKKSRNQKNTIPNNYGELFRQHTSHLS